MNNYANLKTNPPDKTHYSFLQIVGKRWFLTLIFGIIGFMAPMIYGAFNGFPIPVIHDELSYLLAADTYENGRLTNPTPTRAEHFESPHILTEPTYMSKYPPMQGLFLALGDIVFGHPIFGVWLSCGLAAGALFWMISVWSKEKWAAFATVLMILTVGISGYWAQSYWGGMAAATGGALFLGGFRQLFKKLSILSTLIMTSGGLILINSRPFEGGLTMIPATLVLFIWIIREKNHTFSNKFSSIILPGIILSTLGLSAMLYNNYKVTGSITTLPYAIHQKQYFQTPLILFQAKNIEGTKGHPRLREYYDNLTMAPTLKGLFDTKILPDIIYLYPIYAFCILITAIPYFFLPPPLLILFYITVPLLAKKSRWLALIIAIILFTFVCMSFAAFWDSEHYSAPLMCCFYLLVAEGFEYFYENAQKQFQKRIILSVLFLIGLATGVYAQIYLTGGRYTSKDFIGKKEMIFEALTKNEPITLSVPGKPSIAPLAVALKGEIESAIEMMPEKYIIIVSYPGNTTVYDEMVYNKADFEKAKLIWAHDLGAEKNKALLGNYSNRKVLWINVSTPQIEINPIQPITQTVQKLN